MFTYSPRLSLALAVTLTPFAAQASQCTNITSLPALLDAPGHYCLAQDFTFTAQNDTAIEISSGGIILDFQGHSITGPYADGGSGDHFVLGVGATDVLKDVTIKNGTINGFLAGVGMFANSSWGSLHSNIVIEDMRFIDNMTYAFGAEYIESTVLRNNTVDVSSPRHISAATLDGFEISRCRDVTLSDNDVDFVSAGYKHTFGLITVQCDRMVIKNNSFAAHNAASSSRGISFHGSTSIINNNEFIGFPTAINAGSGSSVIYRNNTATWNYTNQGYTGGTDGGGNFSQ